MGNVIRKMNRSNQGSGTCSANAEIHFLLIMLYRSLTFSPVVCKPLKSIEEICWSKIELSVCESCEKPNS